MESFSKVPSGYSRTGITGTRTCWNDGDGTFAPRNALVEVEPASARVRPQAVACDAPPLSVNADEMIEAILLEGEDAEAEELRLWELIERQRVRARVTPEHRALQVEVRTPDGAGHRQELPIAEGPASRREVAGKDADLGDEWF